MLVDAPYYSHCKLFMQCFVAGIVCAVKGHVATAGKFEVMEICFAGLPQPTLQLDILQVSKVTRFEVCVG